MQHSCPNSPGAAQTCRFFRKWNPPEQSIAETASRKIAFNSSAHKGATKFACDFGSIQSKVGATSNAQSKWLAARSWPG